MAMSSAQVTLVKGCPCPCARLSPNIPRFRRMAARSPTDYWIAKPALSPVVGRHTSERPREHQAGRERPSRLFNRQVVLCFGLGVETRDEEKAVTVCGTSES